MKKTDTHILVSRDWKQVYDYGTFEHCSKMNESNILAKVYDKDYCMIVPRDDFMLYYNAIMVPDFNLFPQVIVSMDSILPDNFNT